MSFRSLTRLARACGGLVLAAATATPAPAYLFWSQPALQGTPVNGDEPGIMVPLAGASPKELKAGLLWTMRAGLNVAALQCQFAPGLMTVPNYNALLRQHAVELQSAYAGLSAYFKRTGGKTWQTKLDQYTTRTYNSFSTLHAQLGFCETAALISRDALTLPAGRLNELAARRMREFRNSLVPTGDARLGISPSDLPLMPLSTLACTDRKGREVACKG